MKLYVWQNCLEDYTCGLAFAVAPSLQKAKRELAKKMGATWKDFLEDYPRRFPEEPSVHELTEPAAFYVYGGG